MTRTDLILCAHADASGEPHWKVPGEPCPVLHEAVAGQCRCPYASSPDIALHELGCLVGVLKELS